MSCMASWVIKLTQMCLVLRRKVGTAYYVHLGTGNYIQKPHSFTPIRLFSCNKELGEDVRRVAS